MLNVATFGEFFRALITRGLESFGMYYSVYRGTVVDNADPMNLGRLRLSVEHVYRKDVPDYWAWPFCSGPVGVNSGLFDIPAPGDPVWVQFEMGRPKYPVWSPGWWGMPGGLNEVPFTAQSNPPEVAVWKMKSGHRLEFDNRLGMEKVVLTALDGSKFEMDIPMRNMTIMSTGSRDTLVTTQDREMVGLGRTSNIFVQKQETVVGQKQDTVLGIKESTVAGGWTITVMGALKVHSLLDMSLTSATMININAPLVNINSPGGALAGQTFAVAQVTSLASTMIPSLAPIAALGLTGGIPQITSLLGPLVGNQFSSMLPLINGLVTNGLDFASLTQLINLLPSNAEFAMNLLRDISSTGILDVIKIDGFLPASDQILELTGGLLGQLPLLSVAGVISGQEFGDLLGVINNSDILDRLLSMANTEDALGSLMDVVDQYWPMFGENRFDTLELAHVFNVGDINGLFEYGRMGELLGLPNPSDLLSLETARQFMTVGHLESALGLSGLGDLIDDAGLLQIFQTQNMRDIFTGYGISSLSEYNSNFLEALGALQDAYDNGTGVDENRARFLLESLSTLPFLESISSLQEFVEGNSPAMDWIQDLRVPSFYDLIKDGIESDVLDILTSGSVPGRNAWEEIEKVLRRFNAVEMRRPWRERIFNGF